ncbi:MAG: hypothetical protein ACK5B9_04445 [Flavobacteriia bacterium]|jgi:predicted GNAT family acetyltransferase
MAKQNNDPLGILKNKGNENNDPLGIKKKVETSTSSQPPKTSAGKPSGSLQALTSGLQKSQASSGKAIDLLGQQTGVSSTQEVAPISAPMKPTKEQIVPLPGTQNINKGIDVISKTGIGLGNQLVQAPLDAQGNPIQNFSPDVKNIYSTPEQVSGGKNFFPELTASLEQDKVVKEPLPNQVVGTESLSQLPQATSEQKVTSVAKEQQRKVAQDKINAIVNSDIEKVSKDLGLDEEQKKLLLEKRGELTKSTIGDTFDFQTEGVNQKIDEVEKFVEDAYSINIKRKEASDMGVTLEDVMYFDKKQNADKVLDLLPDDMKEQNKELFRITSSMRDLLTEYNVKVDDMGNLDLSSIKDSRTKRYLDDKLGGYIKEYDNLLNTSYNVMNDKILESKRQANEYEMLIKKVESLKGNAKTYEDKKRVELELNEAKKKLQQYKEDIYQMQKSKNSFFSVDPNDVKAEFKSSQTAKTLFSALPKDLSSKDKFDLFYSRLAEKNEVLAEKLGIDNTREESLNAGAKDWLDWDGIYDLSSEEKEYYSNKKMLRDMATIYLNNSTGLSNKSSGFIESFMSSAANWIQPNTEMRATETTIAKGQLEGLKKAGFSSKDLTSEQSVKQLEKRIEDVPFFSMETAGEMLGTTGAIMAELIVGDVVLAPLKSVKAVKTLATAYDKAMDSSKVLKFIKPAVDQGIKMEAVGTIFSSAEDELNFTSGVLGGLGGELVGVMSKKLGSEALSKYVSSVFGSQADKANYVLKRAGEINNRGLGEVGEEVTQELVGIYNDELRTKGFWDEVSSRYGDLSDIGKLVVSSYVMGSAFGMNTKSAAKEWYNSLPKEEKTIVDAIEKDVNEDVAKSAEAVVEKKAEIVDKVEPDKVVSPAEKEVVSEINPSAEKVTETTTPTETVSEVVKPTIETVEGAESETKYANGDFVLPGELEKMTPEEMSKITFVNPTEKTQEIINNAFPAEKTVKEQATTTENVAETQATDVTKQEVSPIQNKVKDIISNTDVTESNEVNGTKITYNKKRSEELNGTTYSITKDGKEVGEVMGTVKPNGDFETQSITVNEEVQGKGIGKDVYTALNETLPEGNKIVASGMFNEEGGVKKGEKLWKSLVRDGKAIETKNGYEMIPTENIVETQATDVVKEGTDVNKGEKITVFRGVGNNVINQDNSSTFWVSESEDVAKNYAGVKEDGKLDVQKLEVEKPSNPIEMPYKLATDVRGSDISNNLRSVAADLVKSGELKGENITKAIDLISDFEKKAGEDLELFSTKMNKPEANEAFSKAVQALGFNGISQKESAIKGGEKSNTYGIFKNTHPSLLESQQKETQTETKPSAEIQEVFVDKKDTNIVNKEIKDGEKEFISLEDDNKNKYAIEIGYGINENLLSSKENIEEAKNIYNTRGWYISGQKGINGLYIVFVKNRDILKDITDKKYHKQLGLDKQTETKPSAEKEQKTKQDEIQQTETKTETEQVEQEKVSAENKEIINKSKENAKGIESGTKVFKRFSQDEQSGISKGGRIHAESTLILGEKNGANKETSATNEEQENIIEQYAKEEGIWVEDINKEYGEHQASGEESLVWVDESDKVTKSQSTNLYNDLQEKLDSITLQNALFPESALKVIGFGRTSDGEFQIIVEQPFIEAKEGEKITDSQIEDYMSKLGFERVEDNNYSNGDTLVEDLHTGNVILDTQGNIIVIDPIIRLNTKEQGYGGSRDLGNNEVEEKVSAEKEKPSESKPKTEGGKQRSSMQSKRFADMQEDEIANEMKRISIYDVNNEEQQSKYIDELLDIKGAEGAIAYVSDINNEVPLDIRLAVLTEAGARISQDALADIQEATKNNDEQALKEAENLLEKGMRAINKASLEKTKLGQIISYTRKSYEKYPSVFLLEKRYDFEKGTRVNPVTQENILETRDNIQSEVDGVVDETLRDEVVEKLKEKVADLEKQLAEKKSSKSEQKAQKVKDAKVKFNNALDKFRNANKGNQASASIIGLNQVQIEAIGEMIAALAEMGVAKTGQIVNQVYEAIKNDFPSIRKEQIRQVGREVAEFEALHNEELSSKEKTKLQKLEEKLAKLQKGEGENLSTKPNAEDSEEVKKLKEQIEAEKVITPKVLRELVKEHLRGANPSARTLAQAIASKTGKTTQEVQDLADTIEELLNAKLEDLVKKEHQKFIDRQNKLEGKTSTEDLKQKRREGKISAEELKELESRIADTKSKDEVNQIMKTLRMGALSDSNEFTKAFEKRFGFKNLNSAIRRQLDAIAYQIFELEKDVQKEVLDSEGNVKNIVSTARRSQIGRLQKQFNTLLDSTRPWTAAKVFKEMVSAIYINMLSGPLTFVRAFVGGYSSGVLGTATYVISNLHKPRALMQGFIAAYESLPSAYRRAVQSRKSGYDLFGESSLKGDQSQDSQGWYEKTLLNGLGEALDNKEYGKVVLKSVGQLLKVIHALGSLDAFMNTVSGAMIGTTEAVKGGTFNPSNKSDLNADYNDIALTEWNEIKANAEKQVDMQQPNISAEKRQSEVTKIIKQELGIRGSRLDAKKTYVTNRVQELRENALGEAFVEGVQMSKDASLMGTPDGLTGYVVSKVKPVLNIKESDNALLAASKFLLNGLFKFVRITGQLANKTMNNIPLIGILNAFIGPGFNHKTGEFDLNIIKGKVRSNPLLVKQRVFNNILITATTIVAYSLMFEDDDEEGIKLKKDRPFDLRAFGNGGMGGKGKNERKYENFQNLSVSFTKDKDGNWTNYVSVKLTPELAAMVATLGSLSDLLKGDATNEEIRAFKLNPTKTALWKAFGSNTKILTESSFSSVGRIFKNIQQEDNIWDGLSNAGRNIIIDNVKPMINPTSFQSITKAVQSSVGSKQKDARDWKYLAQNLYGLDSFIDNNKTDVFGNEYPEENDYERFLKEFTGGGEKRSDKFKTVGLLYKFDTGANVSKRLFSEMKPTAEGFNLEYKVPGFGRVTNKYQVNDKDIQNEAMLMQEKEFNRLVLESYDYLNSIDNKDDLEEELKALQDESSDYAKYKIVEKYEGTKKIELIEQ